MSLWRIKKNISKTDCFGKKVYRIQAKEDFLINGIEIKKGELGGWISKSSNLNKKVWINESITISGDSYLENYFDGIMKNVNIGGNARIHIEGGSIRNSQIYGNIQLFGAIKIDNSKIEGNWIQISGISQIMNVEIYSRYGLEIGGDSFINSK